MDVALVDHHRHTVARGPLDRAGLEALLTESDRPPPPGCSAFDSLLGLAVRRRCAPILDLPADAYRDAHVARQSDADNHFWREAQAVSAVCAVDVRGS